MSRRFRAGHGFVAAMVTPSGSRRLEGVGRFGAGPAGTPTGKRRDTKPARKQRRRRGR